MAAINILIPTYSRGMAEQRQFLLDQVTAFLFLRALCASVVCYSKR